MPTWAELDKEKEKNEKKKMKSHKKGIRAKGAVFIRHPGQDLAPIHAAEKENRRLKRTLKQRQREAEAANVVAKSKKAMMILDLKKDGVPDYEAVAIAEQTFKDQAAAPKTQEQKDIEVRVNEEAKNIFAAWDDDGDGQLTPAELRQALALAGFNTGTDFVEEIMEEFDTDGDGMMDEDEFRVMLHVLYSGQRSKGVFGMMVSLIPGVSDHAIYQNEVLTDKEIDRYKKVFNDADESGDMLLDEGELQYLLVKSGFIYGQRSFVYEGMRNMDTSGDGAVDFGEFLAFMAKIKTKKLENDSWLGFGSSTPPPPPLPPVVNPGYFKVARFFPSLAPVFEKRFCELAEDGQLVVAETRGAVMRLLSKTNANRSGRGYDLTGEVVIDLSFVDEVIDSPWSNSAKTKIEVSTLTEVWYFKAETKAAAEAWKNGLAAWRDHLAFKHYCKAHGLHDPRYDEVANEAAIKKQNRKSARKSVFDPVLSPLLQALDEEGDGKKKKGKGKKNKNKSASMSSADMSPTAGAGGGGEPVTRPGSMTKSKSKLSMSMESVSDDYDSEDDDTLSYDFSEEDPDSGTDDEEQSISRGEN